LVAALPVVKMPTETIVLVASVYDQADILSDYIQWHLHLGITNGRRNAHRNNGMGKYGEFPELRFLHYPIRGFDKLEAKVTAGIAFFEKNTHLEPWWNWHWRRWIRLYREGRLREDYESQFLSPARAQELVREGICTVDETVANWISSKNSAARRTSGEA
jgi:hypothetical protein